MLLLSHQFNPLHASFTSKNETHFIWIKEACQLFHISLNRLCERSILVINSMMLNLKVQQAKLYNQTFRQHQFNP